MPAVELASAVTLTRTTTSTKVEQSKSIHLRKRLLGLRERPSGPPQIRTGWPFGWCGYSDRTELYNEDRHRQSSRSGASSSARKFAPQRSALSDPPVRQTGSEAALAGVPKLKTLTELTSTITATGILRIPSIRLPFKHEMSRPMSPAIQSYRPRHFSPSRAARAMQTFTTIGPPNRPLLQGEERLAQASLFPHPREPK